MAPTPPGRGGLELVRHPHTQRLGAWERVGEAQGSRANAAWPPPTTSCHLHPPPSLSPRPQFSTLGSSPSSSHTGPPTPCPTSTLRRPLSHRTDPCPRDLHSHTHTEASSASQGRTWARTGEGVRAQRALHHGTPRPRQASYIPLSCLKKLLPESPSISTTAGRMERGGLLSLQATPKDNERMLEAININNSKRTLGHCNFQTQ